MPRAASAPGTPRSSAQAAVYRTRLQQGGDGYQLNFENASLAEVVKVILGDTLKLPYHYDPRVQGQVTLSTGQAVSREELLAVLESALKMNNAALIGGDGALSHHPRRGSRGRRRGLRFPQSRRDGDAGLRRQRAAAAQRLGRGDAAPARRISSARADR